MKPIAVAALLLLLAACGGEENAPEGSISRAAEAPKVRAIIDELHAAGIDCDADPSGPEETAYSEQSQRCYTVADESESLTVSVYASAGQLEDAKAYLTELNPGTAYVWGERWSVSAPDNATAEQVDEALNG